MLGAEGLRMADKPLGVLPALASLLVLVLFESLMLIPATGVYTLTKCCCCWCSSCWAVGLRGQMNTF